MWTLPKLSRLSGYFPDCPDTFQPVWTLFRLSGHFPDCPDTFHIVRTIFGHILVIFKHFRVQRAKTFRTRKNFPGSNATTLPTFFCLCFTGIQPGFKLVQMKYSLEKLTEKFTVIFLVL